MKKFTYNPNMFNCVISENGADIIASVDRRKGQSQDDQAGIARLFASAPELLAALESVVYQLEVWPGDKNPESFACMKNARLIIAKAKG